VHWKCNILVGMDRWNFYSFRDSYRIVPSWQYVLPNVDFGMWNLCLGKDGQCFAKLSSWLVVIKGLDLIIFYPRFVSCDIVIRPGLDQSTHIERNRRNVSHWLSFGIPTDQVAMLKTPRQFWVSIACNRQDTPKSESDHQLKRLMRSWSTMWSREWHGCSEKWA